MINSTIVTLPDTDNKPVILDTKNNNNNNNTITHYSIAGNPAIIVEG
jgi:hypothetical protein